MKRYSDMTAQERRAEYEAVKATFEAQKAQGLKLDMSRGKPGREQLDLVTEMATVLRAPEDFITDGIDSRNYGNVDGLPAAKRLFADILGCRPEQCFVGGNASLQLMYDAIAKAYSNGMLHSPQPWSKLDISDAPGSCGESGSA